MMDLAGIEDSIPADAVARFRRWESFLHREVDFLLGDGSIHTYGHCSRVLLYAIMMAGSEGLDEDETEAVAAAAVFHDCRRKDDWMDVGHGRRAADHYEEYCRDSGMRFDPRTYMAMAYHDLDDAEGLSAIRDRILDCASAVRVFTVLKDADALDRFRLGPCGLDPNYLRTESSKRMVGLARNLVAGTPSRWPHPPLHSQNPPRHMDPCLCPCRYCIRHLSNEKRFYSCFV